MLEKQWMRLKSGTDIRGVATEGVPGEPVTLTNEAVARIVFGFARWLKGKYGKEACCVAVGHDSRLSGPRIRDVAVETLAAGGCRVVCCGLSSTPAMFMTTVRLGCDGAVQITASHHPFHRNGLKFFCREGGLDSGDILQILAYAQEGIPQEQGPRGQVEYRDFMRQYAADLRKIICDGVGSGDQPLKGYHIVVDAGNGAGGFYATEVLEPLGADITGSQFLEPDGRFPNHIPNPENQQAMDSACEATVKHRADLGVIFDTDVDRAGCVDRAGREINRNRLVALASAIALRGNEGGTIVTDSITSSGLKTFIEENLGGVHRRFKRGYRNVINECVRLNREGVNSPLAIETSGHAALRENYYLDDGAYLITRIIIEMARLGKEGKQLDDLIAGLQEPAEAVELRFPILEQDFAAYGQKVIEELQAYAVENGWTVAPDNFEGIRVSFGPGQGDGWFLLRLSVHDPIMPLNIESDVKGGVREIAEKLSAFLKAYPQLDLDPMEAFLAG